MVVGIVYKSDGHTPAANAKVTIRLRKTLADTSKAHLFKRAAAAADTAAVVTDTAGHFSIDSIDTGLYVIEANSGDTTKALKDSVHVVNKDSSLTVNDTLKPVGNITGTVILSEGGDPRKVFILAYGINRFAEPDSNGRFAFDSLAEAHYDLRVISTLDNYGVLDTTRIPVISKQTTSLDSLRLPFTGIPTPKNVTISYDTLNQIVTLIWSKADTALVKHITFTDAMWTLIQCLLELICHR